MGLRQMGAADHQLPPEIMTHYGLCRGDSSPITALRESPVQRYLNTYTTSPAPYAQMGMPVD